MSDPTVTTLLERLATTAPEPHSDLVDAVHRRARTREPRRLAPMLVAFATVVALLAAVGVVTLVFRDRSTTPATPPTDLDGTEAMRAARDFSQVFFSPDYRTISRYSDEVEAGSTGTFRQDFATKRSDLARTLTQARSVAEGRVLAAAARDVTPSSATVLLVADQDVRNTTSRGHTVANRYRVGAHLIRSDGRWLVTALEPIVGGSYGSGCTDVTATPARQDLLAQTCANVARLFSLGYRTLDADLAAQRAAAVEPFRSEIGSVTNPSIRPLAAKEHIVVRATASTAAVEQQDTDTATVLVFLDQNTTVATLKEPRVDRNRLQVTMTRVDGRWLVSGLRAL